MLLVNLLNHKGHKGLSKGHKESSNIKYYK